MIPVILVTTEALKLFGRNDSETLMDCRVGKLHQEYAMEFSRAEQTASTLPKDERNQLTETLKRDRNRETNEWNR